MMNVHGTVHARFETQRSIDMAVVHVGASMGYGERVDEGSSKARGIANAGDFQTGQMQACFFRIVVKLRVAKYPAGESEGCLCTFQLVSRGLEKGN